MAKRRAGAGRSDTSGEVWVSIIGFKRKYYISRTDLGTADRTDDEAQLEILGKIGAVTPALKKHLGATIDISFLSAQDYTSSQQSVSPFFGSLTMRGSQRSALAYLPAKPFWELPSMIEGGTTWCSLGWNSMRRGSANLTSVFLGDVTDLEEFASDCERYVGDVGRT